MNDVSSITESNILISALDWGFGHTTRTSLLINQLIKQNNQVVFAGNADQISFITSEYPDVKCLSIDGYGIRLDSRKNTYLQVISQLPKVFSGIKNETKWVKRFTESNAINYIISDNRYGFRKKGIKSIILTHQLNLAIPVGGRIASWFIKRQINRFDTCWIPDTKERKISGELSKGNLRTPKVFIGPLSRFKIDKTPKTTIDYLFLISGPEPERTTFFLKTLEFVQQHDINASLCIPFKCPDHIDKVSEKIIEFPNSQKLESLINSSKIIVTKTGYTTLMDLIPFNKPCILIPTKGQFEQEYLWELHASKSISNEMSEMMLSKLS